MVPKTLSKPLARGLRSLRAAGPQRLILTALLLVAAVWVARFGWTVPVIEEAERSLYDQRAYLLAEQVEQDPRVLMIVYSDQTLIDSRKRSPLDRGLLARALRNIDGLGAKAIGIDILFDQPQDEDEQLIAALREMKTPTFVGYAETATNEGQIKFEQQEFLKRFIRSLEGSNASRASVRLDDNSGVTRIWPIIERDLPPVLGRAMLAGAGEEAKALPGYLGAIRYRERLFEESPVFTELAIDTFADPPDPETLAAFSALVTGRYVLIGGNIIDYDRVPTTFTAATHEVPPGLEVHAHMIAQMLDGARLPRPSPATLWAAALLVVVSAMVTAMLELRSWRLYPLLVLQGAVLLGLPFLLHARGIDTYGLPSIGWLVGWIVTFASVTAAARASVATERSFAQGALGKYLPREMAQEIIDNPELLALHGEKKEIYVLFSDLEGFTKMSHAIEPEMVAKLLNRYLEMLSKVVLDHGGVIDKFVGDAVVAFWGAPIALADDGERAAKAGYAMWQAGEEFRQSADPGLPPIGKTRVGLHWGEAVVGNFGGENRIQYTALGDSMNTASRLESANKALDSGVMASREFVERAGLDWWRPMGRVMLRGRSKPVDLFEPAPDFPAEDRAALYQAMILTETDRAAAIEVIAELAARHTGDSALVNLLERTRKLPASGAYVLD